MSKKTEIQALIRLLDDEDEHVVDNVSKKLVSYGEEVIFNLENSWEQTVNPVLTKRLEEVIQKIQFQAVYNKLERWLKDPFPDLYKGAEIIAQYQYPDLDTENLRTQIDGIKQKIWLELNNDLTPLETISVFNQIFYGYLGFKSDYKSKPDISYYCINEVVSSKKGTSISIGILYIIIAQELNIPIYGVNLHQHFILSYQKRFIENFDKDNSIDSMFYINAFNKGVVFEREEIKSYLKKMKKDKKVEYFSPADNKMVIKELLNYISYYLSNAKLESKVFDVDKILSLFNI